MQVVCLYSSSNRKGRMSMQQRQLMVSRPALYTKEEISYLPRFDKSCRLSEKLCK